MESVAGGFFTGRYTSLDNIPEEGSRFDPNRSQGQVGSIFSHHALNAPSFTNYYTRIIAIGPILTLVYSTKPQYADKEFINRYWKEPYFEALASIQTVAEKFNLTLTEIALRWMSHHSLLKREYGDSILIGASSLNHIEQVCVFSPDIEVRNC